MYCHVTVPIQKSKITIKIISITTWNCTTILIALHVYSDYLVESLTNLLKYYNANSNFVNLLCFMQIILYYFHYDTKIIKLESLLVDCCVVESSESSCIGPLSLSKKYLSSFLCRPIFAVNFLEHHNNQPPSLNLIFPSFSVDCWVFEAAMGLMER